MDIVRRILGVAAVALCVATAPARASVIIGAPGDPGNGNCYPFGCQAIDPTDSNDWGTEYQQVYTSADFSGPITITSISFFRNNVSGFGSGLDTGTYTISLAISANPVNGLSTTDLASNITAGTEVTVFTGALPASAPFGSRLDFVFSTPFTYNPSLGNLLLDIMSLDAVQPGDNTYFDARNGSFGSESSRATNGDQVVGFDSYGLVTGFNVPEPSSFVLFAAGLFCFGLLRRRRLRRE